jgi:rhodanese-related sulfurtransferase
MPTFQNYLKEIKSGIEEIDASGTKQIWDRKAGDVALIDVREQDEYVQGYIPGASWIPRGYLELRTAPAARARPWPRVR